MRRATQISGLALLLSLCCAAARAESVGNVGAVNQSARGAPPGQAARTLSLGASVENRERIETDADGSAQIVFRDTSTMTVGRNSQVTVDRFIYNGDASAGSQAVSLAKGAMRFIGGGVSHEGGANVRLPTASIGLRGGSALFETNSSCGGDLIVLLYGAAQVTTAQGTFTLTRPGYGVCICANVFSDPMLIPSSWLEEIGLRLSSGPTQTGGALAPPQNQQANRGLGPSRPPTGLAEGEATDWLDGLGLVWGGSAVVQSRGAVLNMPAPPPPAPPPSSQ
ncbi:MAG TPA: FecR family protein [Methylocystis sp.]|nr:FecR family protein [Methylocystis sp.]